ncbi:MAG: LacI family DNA-binding transcriptional regulator [Pseudomonadota bacterium]
MDSKASTTGESRRRTQPTIDDVASEAGVSTATISRTLNEPERVSQKTRERVLAAVDRLGYQPNFSAKALAASRTGTVGAIIPTMDNAIFARGLQAFQEELGAHGYTLLVASSSYHPELEAQQVRKLVARGVDALMLIGTDRESSVYRYLEDRAVPLVTAWAFRDDAPVPCVGFDNRNAMATLTRKVLALGHRRLAIISAPTAYNDRARERVKGALSAIEQSGLPAASVPIVEVTYAIANGAEAFAELMGRDAPPTAVLCGNDVLAVGALGRARQMGLSVPGDVSITGFDDIELAEISFPPLTTVHVPHRQMGQAAARLLVNLIRGDHIGKQTALETKIVERGTLERPKGAA